MSTLHYLPFSKDAQLADALKNNPKLCMGMSGSGVALIQGALLDLKKYPLPISTRKTGAPDGRYGSETAQMIIKYQRLNSLQESGCVDTVTLKALDLEMAILVNPGPLPPIPYPRPKPPPRLPEYTLGTADPTIKPDKGAGPWNSKPKQHTFIAMRGAVLAYMGDAAVFVGYDAAKHLEHYLMNGGREITIDLEDMISDVPSARKRYEAEVGQFKEFAGTLPLGTHDITSTNAERGQNLESESTNWYFGVGDYASWAKGHVVVTERDGKKWFKADIEYKFYDRYNWDKKKGVTIFGIQITDQVMGEFHLQGLAREFDMRGAFTRTLEWGEGDLYKKPFVRA